MAFKSLQLFLLLASMAAQAISARVLHSHKSFPLLFPQHLQGSRKGHKVEGIHGVKMYLQRYGYLSNVETNFHGDAFDDLLESAIEVYQKNFNLNVSGILDAETLILMSQSRCGVPDIFNNETSKTGSGGDGHLHMGSLYAFLPEKQKWPSSKYHLTYAFINNYPTDFIDPVTQAFDLWSAHSRFLFTVASHVQSADIVISFERGDHGDGHPFNGRGGVLAHAFWPPDGRVHFNGDEIWSVGAAPDAYDVKTTALHELGHILGLGHSSTQDAIMWPYIYPNFIKGLYLDDTEGLRALYQD